MSTANVIVTYDGPILANHRMDVADLAPALLGISELCKIANRTFNGERAAVQVLIGADIEQQCFQIDLQVVQSLWDHAKNVLNNDDVGSAKNLLEWIGLIGGGGAAASGTVLGVFKLLKWLGGRKIGSTECVVQDGREVVRVTIEGDHNSVVLVHPQALELLQHEAVLANVKRVVQPVLQAGYEIVQFQAKGQSAERIDKSEAEVILRAFSSDAKVLAQDCPQTITAWVSVYSPVFDASAKKWRFKFGDARELMDISETDIAAMVMDRGGVMIDDAFLVELQITQELKNGGPIVNHYKIKKVLDCRLGQLPTPPNRHALEARPSL
jgi:hypothetical protein